MRLSAYLLPWLSPSPAPLPPSNHHRPPTTINTTTTPPPQVLLRILGTCAGASVGFAAVAIAPSSPPALVGMLCAFALLIAPMASASFHLRLAMALTFISACVVVLCQVRGVGGSRDCCIFGVVASTPGVLVVMVLIAVVPCVALWWGYIQHPVYATSCRVD